MIKKIVDKIKEKGVFYTVIFSINSILYMLVFNLVYFLSKNKKIQKLIIFYSLPDFSDNSKELYNYYLENEKYKDYKFVWLVDKPRKYRKMNLKNTIFVKDKSKLHSGRTIKAVWYTSVAEILYYTHSCPIISLKKYKKNGQLVINLWHGCGYKNIENRTVDNRKEVLFDYVLVPGKVFIETKSKFFGCDKEKVLDIGYPRYDLLFKENKNTEMYMKRILSSNKKFIIWMPTFRKTNKGYYPEEKINKNFDLPILNSYEDLVKLNNLCKENQIILCIKRHPLQIKYDCEKEKLSNVIFIDNNDLSAEKIDLYSLLKYSDGLITDYSSVAIDYLLLDKPIAFTLDDFDNYAKYRGFVFENPKEYMPGNHIYNYENMLDFIKQISNNQDLYSENRKAIIGKVHNKCNNYCARTLDVVEKLEVNYK